MRYLYRAGDRNQDAGFGERCCYERGKLTRNRAGGREPARYTMQTSILPASLILALFPFVAYAQTPSADVKIAEAKLLVVQLTGDAQKDAAVFQSVGPDH